MVTISSISGGLHIRVHTTEGLGDVEKNPSLKTFLLMNTLKKVAIQDQKFKTAFRGEDFVRIYANEILGILI